MPAARKRELTTPDLVLLSLLAERPLHGYQANAELERREVRDWAGISRPQVYYSIEKLASLGLIRTNDARTNDARTNELRKNELRKNELRKNKVRATETDSPGAGPERRVFQTTAKGRAALADALEREEWTAHRERPPFLTWIALSWQARPGVFRQQIKRRRKFLENELSREEATLLSIKKEVGHRFHEAVWMVSLIIEQFRGELRWLRKLERELPRRAAAKHTH
jgi:DNA-binding PadR family transcriptional regulator